MSIYLSKLVLNKNSTEVRRDLNDCNELHRTIRTIFLRTRNNNKVVGDEGRLLYRLGEDLQRKEVYLLIQSEVVPDWSQLPKGYLANKADSMVCKVIDFVYDYLSEGMVVKFHLRANPTTKEPGTRKRKALKTDDELKEWIKRKGSQHGFELLSVTTEITVEKGTRKANNSPSSEKKTMFFNAVTFEGQLQITNKELFIAALKFGLGSGKGYGFGLLSISPS